MTASAIRSNDLTFRFGAVEAVRNVTLDVPSGKVFGFLGPNGAGKTTTIRLLLGLLEPTCGTAEVLGLDTRHDAAAIRERTGALLEFPGLYERLSAEDNLDFYLRVWRWSRDARRERIRELLSHLGLWDRRGDLVATWSAGMKQKLAVARALVHRPQLLFLDEPSAGLDLVATRALREDIRLLVEREGTTVFLTSHSLDEVEELCSSVAVILQGRIVAQGTLDELCARAHDSIVVIEGSGFTPEIVRDVREHCTVAAVEADRERLNVRVRPGSTAAAIVSLLVYAGATITEVRSVHPSFEQVYLDLVEADP